MNNLTLVALPFDTSRLPALARDLSDAVREYGRGSEQAAVIVIEVPGVYRDRLWGMVDSLLEGDE